MGSKSVCALADQFKMVSRLMVSIALVTPAGVSVPSVQKVQISLLCEINSLTGHIIYFSNNISDFL
jgi:hypothetical protein